ncbi:hypothetical protein AQJ27_20360 [Streptomyces olivochromogenes]|nr:hypothetical protein AQJ27_20360 [Streptomyces olivochromogenes]
MELHALHRQRPVPQPHHIAVVRGDGRPHQRRWQRVGHQQRVVAGGLQRVAEPLEQPGAVVPHGAGPAVHHLLGDLDPAAVGEPDGLVPQADPEERNPPGELVDQLHVSGVGGMSRPRAEDHGVRLPCGEPLGRTGQRPYDLRARPERAQILVDDVDEAVVRVHQKHSLPGHDCNSSPVSAQ